ncbi:MAG: hypothetical protein Q7U33_05785 [Methylotenera sp.]|uniref:hypothetical protein n=1 Tax=Methylotenera sp. TaxID=2051956 RepID=UPI0027198920|nr:hypothetical protein [Methylotenera sp.]MDO9150873.1 hypothetical protein [Methylotenera sp.]
MARHLNIMPLMVVVLIVSMVTIVMTARGLYLANRYNDNLNSNRLHNTTTHEAVFADAYLWKQKANDQKSLALYASITNSKDTNIGQSAHYNTANIYLSQATKLLDDHGLEAWDKAMPLLSLAKESYRDALRLKPDWIDAKYNYELALRLSPIIESQGRKASKEDEEEKDMGVPPDGWPSIPGFPRGMP